MPAIALKTKMTTPRVDDTRAFYERVLGMIVLESWDEPGDRGVILALAPAPREALLEIYEGPAARFDGLGLQFKVENLDAFIRNLSPDMTFEGPTPRPWGSTYIYLRDPNGVNVVVFEGGL